ncbi:MFS transporter [Effusibacillus pohliae]|uniref:MFS transporter n=1 Tax=Effusibacillus pohliae TaxID=232270 RepID=UPI00035D6382|nr:MFS transporter [Effusibacillus pohliae]
MDAAYRHLRHNIKYSNLQGIFGVLSLNLYNPFIPIFAIKVLHASEQQVAWLSSLPEVTGILALIPGALFLDRLERKQRITGVTLLTARFFLLLIALLPFFPVTGHAFWLVILVALMNFPVSVGNLYWQAFIGRLIPRLERARVFAYRNRITTGVGMLATIVSGVVISRFSNNPAWPYQVFFLLAFAAGLLEVFYLYRLREPDCQSTADVPQREKGFADVMRGLAEEKKFLYFLAASVLFHFGWQMAWPLFNIYQVDERYVNMNALWLSIVTVVNSLTQMLAFGRWGRLAERWGNGKVLVVTGIGMALNPFLYMFTSNAWAVVAINFLIGLFVAGFVQTLFNRQLDLAPPDHRAFYLAIHAVAVGVSGIFAPIAGVAIYKAATMNTAFFVSGTIRLLGAFAFGLVLRWEVRQMRRESRGISA